MGTGTQVSLSQSLNSDFYLEGLHYPLKVDPPKDPKQKGLQDPKYSDMQFGFRNYL